MSIDSQENEHHEPRTCAVVDGCTTSILQVLNVCA